MAFMVNLPPLGSRGQGWVWGQFVIGAVVIVASAVGPPWPWTELRIVGLLVAIAGGVVGTWALYALGDSLTPYPTPRARGSLVQHGPYAVVRHPIYSALLLAMLGICLTGSWWGFIPLAALVAWWLGKSSIEEHHLLQKYPEYADYCQRVRYRMIPFVV